MNLSNKPLVSVIIPYYNHNRFVKKTLDSILEDTYPNKEIIIINDGSTELDSSNLENWIDTNRNFINIIYKKRTNKGITKTLNEMINLSSGKYIALIASDDYFINNTFSKRVDILENNKTKLMLVADAIVVDDDGKLLFQSAMFEQRKAPKKNTKIAENSNNTFESIFAFFCECKIFTKFKSSLLLIDYSFCYCLFYSCLCWLFCSKGSYYFLFWSICYYFSIFYYY